jgi:GDP-L-fucose synthase
MRHWESPDIINVGVGEDVSIAELAELVRSVVGYRGDIVYDATKPDGTPRKLLDVSRITRSWGGRRGRPCGRASRGVGVI